MEKKTIGIAITVLFSLIIINSTKNVEISPAKELAILGYFIILFLGQIVIKGKSDLYNHLAVCFFILLVVFSFIQEETASAVVAIFLFFVMVSKWIYTMLYEK